MCPRQDFRRTRPYVSKVFKQLIIKLQKNYKKQKIADRTDEQKAVNRQNEVFH